MGFIQISLPSNSRISQWWWGSGPPGLTLFDSKRRPACRSMLAFNTSWAVVMINARRLVMIWSENVPKERVSQLEMEIKEKRRTQSQKCLRMPIRYSWYQESNAVFDMRKEKMGRTEKVKYLLLNKIEKKENGFPLCCKVNMRKLQDYYEYI